jgi:hypothetical protein
MTISATVKDDNVNLYVYYESLSNTDSVYWKEVALFRNEETITCYGILSSASVGVVNFKEKTWRPDFQIAILKFNRAKRQQWDKDAGKFVTVEVCQDEAKLYAIFSKVEQLFSNQILTGSIKPWINPMYWDLGCEQESEIALAEKIINSTSSLSKAQEPCRLTPSDLSAAREAANKKYGSGGYSKGESTADKTASNLAFLRAQFDGITKFQSIHELAQAIEASSPAGVDADFDYRVYTRMLHIIGLLT